MRDDMLPWHPRPPKAARALLCMALFAIALMPSAGLAKKPKAPSPAAAPTAAPGAPEPATAPSTPPPPAPPLTAPQAAPPVSRGADNAKDVDPATEPEWTISDRQPHQRPHQLSLSLGVWPPTQVSGSVWWAIPVLANGLISSINDSFDIEFGAVVAGYFDGLDHGAVMPAVGARWNFHVTRNFIPFATLKLNMQFGFGPGDPDLFGVDLSLGTLLRISDWAFLRFELGYPQGLAVGVGFPVGG